jgi:uncharacterized membrane protein
VSDAFPPAAEPVAAGSRRLKYALIASLAFNLLVVGIVGGTMFGFGKHPRPHFANRGEDFGLMGLSRGMPDERRKEFRKKLREDREQLRPLMEEVRAARRGAAEKLAAEPFDRGALAAAFAAAGEKDRTMREAAINAFLTHAETLTPGERRSLSEWWMKKNAPFAERRRKKKDGPDKDKSAESEKAEPGPADE